MSKSSLQRVAVPITSAAVVAGMMLIGSPAGAAPATTPFKNSCQAKNPLATVDKVADTSMTVDAPSSVAPGETFTYRIQPGGGFYPNKDSGATTTTLSRFKVDYAIPGNTTFVSAAVVGTGINLGGVPPSVLRVDDNGNASASGGILRLSGNNQTVGNGPSSSINSEGGITAPKLKKNIDGSTNGNGDSWFQLPAVDVTVTAGAPGVITPKVRGGGNASAYANDMNYYTFLPLASLFGNQWAPTRCIPSDNKSAANAGAGALATITVAEAGPVIVDSATTLNVPATAKTGTAVDLTATVAPAGATGTVEFKDGATVLGTAPVNAGVATLNHTFTTNGAHSITAVYSGDATNRTSTSTASTVEVSTDPVIVDSTTTLNVPVTAKTGTAVDLTATVAPAGATGTVEFKDGATVLGTAPVNAGVATLNHTFTMNGSHSISAVYSGDATNRTSTSAASTVEVSTDPVIVDSTTTLNVPVTAKTGTAVDLTATVAPAGATGTVEFKDGATVLGTAPVNAGVATLNHTFTMNGSHSISAVYSGDATNRTSTSAASTVEVSTDIVVADTTTTLNVPGAATTGDSVELFALVAGNDSTPAEGGTVQFSIDGTNVGGAIAVTGGSAKLDHVFAAGSHSVGAVYSGTTTFNGSTATAASIVVTDPAPVELTTVTTLTAPATATKGAAVNLSASVKTEAGDPVTSGTVTFMDGTTAIGTAVNVVNGQATLSYPFALTGDRHITAVYSGASGLKESTSVASTVTVSAGSTNPGGTGSLSWLGNIFGS